MDTYLGTLFLLPSTIAIKSITINKQLKLQLNTKLTPMTFKNAVPKQTLQVQGKSVPCIDVIVLVRLKQVTEPLSKAV